MIKKSIFTVASVLLFTGCTSALNNIALSSEDKEPKWLLDPYYQNDKLASVGCAAPHFKGVAAQKKLAVARAIDAFATSKKVNVQKVQLMKKSVSGATKSSSMKSTSLQSVDNVSVSTKTKAMYTKKNGEICAWVVSK